MIRGILGDSLWWVAVNRYVTDNAVRTVETEDLKRALETVSGRDFDGFFSELILLTFPNKTPCHRRGVHCARLSAAFHGPGDRSGQSHVADRVLKLGLHTEFLTCGLAGHSMARVQFYSCRTRGTSPRRSRSCFPARCLAAQKGQMLTTLGGEAMSQTSQGSFDFFGCHGWLSF